MALYLDNLSKDNYQLLFMLNFTNDEIDEINSLRKYKKYPIIYIATGTLSKKRN